MRWLLTITCLCISALAQHTYYVSQSSGDDTRTSSTAQTNTTPWKHIPTMLGATSNSKAYIAVAGDRFILKGGDTWVGSDLGINTCPASGCQNGTVGSPIYIGVDQTFFTGAAWVRPKFDCTAGCTITGNAVVWLFSDNWIFDNIEITGVKQGTASLNIIAITGANVEVKNNYVHGWTSTSNPPTTNSYVMGTNFSSGSGGVGSSIHDNVIDGADNPFYAPGGTNDFMGGILHGPTVYNNVIRDIYNGMNGKFNDIHGNLIENNDQAADGDHCNMVYPQSTFSAHTLVLYNNVVRGKGCGTTVFTFANSSDASSIAYQYNNVVYNNQAAGGNDGLGSGGTQATGTYFDYNNTVVSTTNCFGNGSTTATSVTHYQNNHCIAPTVCVSTGTTCTNDGGNIQQAVGTTCGQNPTQTDANCSPKFDQYVSTGTYAYSPVASTNSTVAVGNNLTSQCSGNLSALCTDTAYPEYDSVNHVVTMRTVKSRPSSGAWDIGAFQFSAGSGSPTVSLSPTSINFGNQTVNTTSSGIATTLTNVGTATLIITSITLQGGDGTGSQFTISGNTCGSTLVVNNSCTITIKFVPRSPAFGSQADAVLVTTNASTSPDSVSLSGNATSPTNVFDMSIKGGIKIQGGMVIK